MRNRHRAQHEIVAKRSPASGPRPVPCLLALVLLAVTASGCSAGGHRPHLDEDLASAPFGCLSSAAKRERLLAVYDRYDGVRHRLGATGGRSMDCSAFTREVYREAVGSELPRTTVGQSRVGVAVSRGDLAVGDLVLFRPKSYPRHVGVYVGDGRFIHVSSKRGLTTSSMNDPFWSSHYWTARRLPETSRCTR